MKVLDAQVFGRAPVHVRLDADFVVVHSPSPQERHGLVEGLAAGLSGQPGPLLLTVGIGGRPHTLAGELLGRVANASGGRSPVLRDVPPDPSAIVPDVGHRIGALRDQLRALEQRQHALIDAIVAESPNAAAVESVRAALTDLAAVDPASVHAKRTAYRLRQVLSRLHERRLDDPDDPEVVRLRADLGRLRREAAIALATDRMTDEEMVGALEAHRGPAVAANRPWQKLMDALRAAGVDTRGLEPLGAASRWLNAADQGGRDRQAAYDELGALAVAIPIVRERIIEVGPSPIDPEHDERLPAARARLAGVLAGRRGDGVVGTIPLVVDDAFRRVDADDVPAVLADLLVAAVAVQVLYVTGDADLVAFARGLGERARVVELEGAID